MAPASSARAGSASGSKTQLGSLHGRQADVFGRPSTILSVSLINASSLRQIDICDIPWRAQFWTLLRCNRSSRCGVACRSFDRRTSHYQDTIVGTFNCSRSREYAAASVTGFACCVSTDEVYGSLGPSGLFTEDSPYKPNSPYSASKASADHLARAWFETYRLPVLVTNCSNNYGPFQFPEKLIPLTILKALKGLPVPVYGDGMQVRDWLHVDDHVSGLVSVLDQGTPGQTYNIGGNSERTNLAVVETILRALARRTGKREEELLGLIRFVTDRPGHDRRYAIDAGRMRDQLGWAPRTEFAEGIDATVGWYVDNLSWCERRSNVYSGQRLGVAETEGAH